MLLAENLCRCLQIAAAAPGDFIEKALAFADGQRDWVFFRRGFGAVDHRHRLLFS